MTLPDRCDNCGGILAPWDPEEDTPCKICGATVLTWEHLSPDLRRTRMRLIRERDRIEQATLFPAKDDVL